MPFVFLLLFLVALYGLARPFRGLKRSHFALAALGCFAGVGATVPPLTPEEIAAKKAAEAKEAAEEEAAEANEAAEAARSAQQRIIDKGTEALAPTTTYTKAEYRQTFDRVGAKTFARLGELEPGAVYVAAESDECSRVTSAMVSDQSTRGDAKWFVDCANGNRFMVAQKEAEAALERFQNNALAETKLEASCKIHTVAMCKATLAQKAASASEIEYVTTCQMLLEQGLVSPSSLDFQGRWQTTFGKNDTVIYSGVFDSDNAFGVTLRARYRCDVDAMSGRITRLEIRGPLGTERLI